MLIPILRTISGGDTRGNPGCIEVVYRQFWVRGSSLEAVLG